MSYILCGKCKNLLSFFVPERKGGKFWCHCSSCGAINDLLLDARASSESRPVFRVVSFRSK
jgi:hypothetical protein